MSTPSQPSDRDVSQTQNTGPMFSDDEDSSTSPGVLADFMVPGTRPAKGQSQNGHSQASSSGYLSEELHNAFSSPEPACSSEARLRDLFRNTRPSDIPDVPRGNRGLWSIPECYRAHWERVPESLKNIPISMEGFEAACMTPSPDHVARMYSASKCFKLLDQTSVDRLSAPHHGTTYCFLEKCYSDIPDKSLKTLYFFDTVKKILETQDRHPYVFPTDTIGLINSRKNKKIVTGLYAKNERESDKGLGEAENYMSSQTGGLDIKRLLNARTQEQPEESRCPIEEIMIRHGFSGAEYLNSKAQKCHQNYSVVFVTPAANFPMWSYIFESILSPPKMGSPQYHTQMDLYLSMKTVLEEILNHELVVNLGIQQQDFGQWNDYRFNSGGSLGVNTILSQFLIPSKICHVILGEDSGASGIKIMGLPPMDFTGDDLITSDFVRYMHRHITAIQRSDERCLSVLDRYNQTKDKATFEDAKLEALGGWPLQVSDSGVIEVFGLPPFPLIMNFCTRNAVSRNYDTWFAYIGGKDALPMIVRALLRSFCSIQEESNDVFPDISHFLTDSRTADAVTIDETYFSASVDPFKSLITTNSQLMWFKGFMKDMAQRRSKGMSVDHMVANMEKYVTGAIFNLRGMVSGGGFRSKTIEQMLFICDTMEMSEVCVESDRSIRNRLLRYKARVSPMRRYDRMDCALGSLLDTFEEVNQSFYLNSANLSLLFEMMISQLLYGFGGLNDTWTFFFATIMVMAGNGHYKTSAQHGGVITDNRKPNGTGTDNAINRWMDVINTIYDILGIPPHQRMLLPMACSRFSTIVWEQASTASAAPSTSSASMEIFTQPPVELNGRPLYASEMRGGDSLNPIIKDVLPRNESPSSQAALTTSDPKKTNERVITVKQRIQQPCLILACSNVLDTLQSSEQTRSAGIVSDVMCPGSGPICNKRSREEFHHILGDAFTGRHRKLEDPDGISYFLIYSQVFASLYLGLINRVRATPTEINQPVVALLEWGCFFLLKYFEGMLNHTERENRSRMEQGYRSRGVALGAYIKSIDHLSRFQVAESDNKIEMIKSMVQDMMVDALPMACVPYVLTRIMERCLHMGCTVISMSIAEDLDVPVVSWDELNHFFEDEEPPEEGNKYYHSYKMIRFFFVQCINLRRFAPEDDENDWNASDNISCYISGAGHENLTPLHDKQCYMRLTPLTGKEKVGDKTSDEFTLFSKVARRFIKLKGREMFKTCHMGPETVSYKLAFEDLLNDTVDLRGLASRLMFHSEKHMKKMGLHQHVPGITNYESPDPPPLARQVIFKSEGHVKSEGLAVNPWAMLAIVSLAGQILPHPHCNAALAMGAVTQVLSKAPAGFTPGNACRTRVFGLDSKTIRIFPSAEGRPEHFLRPDDPTFPSTGALSLARQMDRYLPEDMAHCPWLYMLAGNLFCSMLSVPSKAIHSPYNLCPNKIYPAHIPGEDVVYATVEVITDMECVQIIKYTRGPELGEEVDGEITNHDYENWEFFLKAKSFVILPLIERGGACITLKGALEGKVGVLLKFPGTGSQFNPFTGCYQALVSSDNTVAQVYHTDVLESLIAVGTRMFLRLDDYARARSGRYVQVRLNVPNVLSPAQGKVYVTAVCKSSSGSRYYNPTGSTTLEVNPWDLTPESLWTGPAEIVDKWLH